jgi:hypothetical protein
VVTSREKLIPGAPKMLIPGEFGFASDLHAGGNVLSLANLLYAPVIQKLSLANLLCAPGIKVIPGEFALCTGDKSYPWRTRKWFARDKNSKNLKISKNSKKFRKMSKKSKILKTELILKNVNIQFF